MFKEKLVGLVLMGKRLFIERKKQSYNPQYTLKTVEHGGANLNAWASFSRYGVYSMVRIDFIMDKFS